MYRQDFPFNLDSNQNNPAEQLQQITFQNYYPHSEKLRQIATIIPVNNQSAQIVRQTEQKMKQMNVQSLVASQKINIYPKKNTIDLKKHLGKKMVKIQKKTQKAIIHLAKQLMLAKSRKQTEQKQK